jgi:hypothetical protein
MSDKREGGSSIEKAISKDGPPVAYTKMDPRDALDNSSPSVIKEK